MAQLAVGLFVAWVIVREIGNGDFDTGLQRVVIAILVALGVGLVFVLYRYRESFARWYYSLTPHPAQSMVEATMDRGIELDGKVFAEIMRPIPGGRIEKEVRAEQARALAERAHRYAERMRAEAERIKAKAQQDAEYIKAQDELVKAAIVHEQAKARLDALRKQRR